jgi:hypothetical protein
MSEISYSDLRYVIDISKKFQNIQEIYKCIVLFGNNIISKLVWTKIDRETIKLQR